MQDPTHQLFGLGSWNQDPGIDSERPTVKLLLAEHIGDGFASERMIREHILGADPTLIGTIAESPYALRQSGNPPLRIEMALWDLLGKAANQPVSRLLGAYRSQVRAYCSTGSVLDYGDVIGQHGLDCHHVRAQPEQVHWQNSSRTRRHAMVSLCA